MHTVDVKAERVVYVSIERMDDGYYVAEATDLPGCITEGATEEEARRNIEEAISLWLETFLEQQIDERLGISVTAQAETPPHRPPRTLPRIEVPPFVIEERERTGGSSAQA